MRFPPNVMTIAVDLNIKHLLYERDRSRALRVVADANQLPFRDSSVDVVTSSHFFHHFEPEENAAILRGALRIARIGAMASDTRRNVLPFLFVWLLGDYDWSAASPRTTHQPRFCADTRRMRRARWARKTGAGRVDVVKMVPFRFGLLLYSSHCVICG